MNDCRFGISPVNYPDPDPVDWCKTDQAINVNPMHNMPQAQMFSRTHGSVWRQAPTIQVKCTTQKPSFLDMSIQNLCFDRLFNKKNYMKYNNI